MEHAQKIRSFVAWPNSKSQSKFFVRVEHSEYLLQEHLSLKDLHKHLKHYIEFISVLLFPQLLSCKCIDGIEIK